jgi:hypothetical protein
LKTENNRPAEEVSRSPKEAERTKQTDRKRKKRESLYTISLSLTEEHFRRVRKHTDRRKETNFLSLKQAVHHERVRIRKEEGKNIFSLSNYATKKRSEASSNRGAQKTIEFRTSKDDIDVTSRLHEQR